MKNPLPLATDRALFGAPGVRVEPPANHRDLLLARLGGSQVAMFLESILEVARLPSQLTRVPGAPPALAGLLVWRGSVVPVVDLSELVAPGAPRPPGSRPLLIVPVAGGRVGCVVDELIGTCRVPDRAIEASPGAGLLPEPVVIAALVELAPERLDEGSRVPPSVQSRCTLPVMDLEATISAVEALVPDRLPGARRA